MYKIAIKVVLLMLVMSFASTISVAENSLSDENNAKTLIVEDKDTAYSIMRVKGDATLGAMLVSVASGTAYITTASPTEWDVVSVDGASGTDLNPAAQSFGFCFQTATETFAFVKIGSAASNYDGMLYLNGSSKCLFGLNYSTFTVWTPTAATMTVEHWR
ncbi:MAG: hypothetical protein JRL30_27605 [Deltaproteobacteria bacterium]|nr:hypothetical protein [Deltaproteobacteria bacterium]